MTVTINGTDGVSAVAANAVGAGDIQSAAVSQSNLATGVAGTGPAFSAYMSANQTISINTWTKVIFNTESFDTNSNYDPTTNYRFTPTVAGYYSISLVATMNDTAAGGSTEYSAIYKNGAIFSSVKNRDNDGQSRNMSQSTLVYCNGSTDYIEIYAYQGGGTSGNIVGTAGNSVFSGFLARAA